MTRRPRWHKIVPQICAQCFNDTTCNSNIYSEYKDLVLNSYIQNHPEENEQYMMRKRLEMCTGKLWQRLMGQCSGIQDLNNGHETGLDLLSLERKFAVELKNRYNTDNSSAKRANLDKLVAFKKKHPDYEVIYAIINDRKEEGRDYYFEHNDVQIRGLSGCKLLMFIFGKDWNQILNYIHEELNKYTLK